MYPVTQNFVDAIYAPTRQCDVQVTFGVYDVTAAPDATTTVNSVLEHTDETGILLSENNALSIGTLEPDYFLLDGSRHLLSEEGTDSAILGWITQEPSDETGVLATPPCITFTFSSDHTAIGISIDFDVVNNESLCDFSIIYYDASNVVMKQIDVTANTKVKYTNAEAVENFRKVQIVATKTQLPYRRVRISRVLFGVINTYQRTNITTLNLLKEIDILNGALPSDELVVNLDNTDKSFNINNPQGITAYLQKRQPLELSLGVVKADGSVEFAPMGRYFVTEWKAPSANILASLTARDILDALNLTTYRRGAFSSTATMYDVAYDILQDSKIGDLECSFVIDDSLKTIPCPLPVPICSHKEALRMIAQACNCVIYADRDATVIIKPLIIGSVIDTLSYAKVYKPPEIELVPLTTSVQCQIDTWTADSTSVQLYAGTETINGTATIWVQLSQSTDKIPTTVLTNGTLNGAEYFANAAKLTITAAGDVGITITGTSGNYTYQSAIVRHATLSNGQEIPISNALISTRVLANSVAQHVFDLYQRRYKYTSKWRQNPALDLLDVVVMQDEFGNNKQAQLTTNKYLYTGALSGESEVLNV